MGSFHIHLCLTHISVNPEERREEGEEEGWEEVSQFEVSVTSVWITDTYLTGNKTPSMLAMNQKESVASFFVMETGGIQLFNHLQSWPDMEVTWIVNPDSHGVPNYTDLVILTSKAL